MKRGKLKIIIIVVLIVLIVVGAFIVTRLLKKWPEMPVYSERSLEAYTDGGMYYFKEENTLMFLDKKSRESTVVCARPNCEHRRKDCDAFFRGSPDVMVYGDKLYISYFDTEYSYLEDGSSHAESYVALEQCDLDGGHRKILYEGNSGAVTSMYAFDDKLYYAAYEFQTLVNHDLIDTYGLNTYTLYCYDMSWGTTKKIDTFEASETEWNPRINIVNNEVPDEKVYLSYTYWEGKEYGSPMRQKIMVYENGELSEVWSDANQEWKYIDIIKITERGTYFYRAKDFYSSSESKEICFIDNEGKICKVIEENMVEIDIHKYRGYLHIVVDDERKMLYDYENDLWYVANTALETKDKWIPNIYLIDAQNDTVYYDQNDWTGTQAGAFIDINDSMQTCGNWTEFLQENYVPYDGKELDWITIN